MHLWDSLPALFRQDIARQNVICLFQVLLETAAVSVKEHCTDSRKYYVYNVILGEAGLPLGAIKVLQSLPYLVILLFRESKFNFQ